VKHAILDTNILVSALIRPEGPPGLVMATVLRGDLVPVFSDEILAEYERVLRRPRLRLDAVKVQAMLEAMRLVGVRLVVESGLPPSDLPDRDNWPFIACGRVAGCPVVTGNVKHFPKRAGISVMTAREWVGRFE
jgi:putative PIN family toxin of toxin-antitoxin system